MPVPVHVHVRLQRTKVITLAYLLTRALSLTHLLTHLQTYSLTYEEDVLQVVGLEPHIDRLGREAAVREGEPAKG